MNRMQRAFLYLHAYHLVTCWRWQENNTLRADADGISVTISEAEFFELVHAGLIERLGCAGATLTKFGKLVSQGVTHAS